MSNNISFLHSTHTQEPAQAAVHLTQKYTHQWELSYKGASHANGNITLRKKYYNVSQCCETYTLSAGFSVDMLTETKICIFFNLISHTHTHTKNRFKSPLINHGLVILG